MSVQKMSHNWPTPPLWYVNFEWYEFIYEFILFFITLFSIFQTHPPMHHFHQLMYRTFLAFKNPGKHWQCWENETFKHLSFLLLRYNPQSCLKKPQCSYCQWCQSCKRWCPCRENLLGGKKHLPHSSGFSEEDVPHSTSGSWAHPLLFIMEIEWVGHVQLSIFVPLPSSWEPAMLLPARASPWRAACRGVALPEAAWSAHLSSK